MQRHLWSLPLQVNQFQLSAKTDHYCLQSHHWDVLTNPIVSLVTSQTELSEIHFRILKMYARMKSHLLQRRHSLPWAPSWDGRQHYLWHRYVHLPRATGASHNLSYISCHEHSLFLSFVFWFDHLPLLSLYPLCLRDTRQLKTTVFVGHNYIATLVALGIG